MMDALIIAFSLASLVLNLLAFFWPAIERRFGGNSFEARRYTPSMVTTTNNWIGVDDGDWTEWTCYEDGKVVRCNNITGDEIVVKLGAAA